ncbi:MAG: hypothetical protein Q9169_007927 [Polycauliona sp. 2 TL-2023]
MAGNCCFVFDGFKDVSYTKCRMLILPFSPISTTELFWRCYSLKPCPKKREFIPEIDAPSTTDDLVKREPWLYEVEERALAPQKVLVPRKRCFFGSKLAPKMEKNCHTGGGEDCVQKKKKPCDDKIYGCYEVILEHVCKSSVSDWENNPHDQVHILACGIGWEIVKEKGKSRLRCKDAQGRFIGDRSIGDRSIGDPSTEGPSIVARSGGAEAVAEPEGGLDEQPEASLDKRASNTGPWVRNVCEQVPFKKPGCEPAGDEKCNEKIKLPHCGKKSGPDCDSSITRTKKVCHADLKLDDQRLPAKTKRSAGDLDPIKHEASLDRRATHTGPWVQPNVCEQVPVKKPGCQPEADEKCNKKMVFPHCGNKSGPDCETNTPVTKKECHGKFPQSIANKSRDWI